MFERSKVSKKLNNLSKKDHDLVECVFKQLDTDVSLLKSKIKFKYEQKIKNLELKYLKEKGNQCPDHLERFSDIKLYKGDLVKPDVNVKVDMIGDIVLDEEEEAILSLPPDFAVLSKLKDE